MGNVGQRQRLCNCVNSQIFEGYPGVGETGGKWVVNFRLELKPDKVVAKFESPDVLWKKLNRVKDCV